MVGQVTQGSQNTNLFAKKYNDILRSGDDYPSETPSNKV